MPCWDARHFLCIAYISTKSPSISPTPSPSRSPLAGYQTYSPTTQPTENATRTRQTFTHDSYQQCQNLILHFADNASCSVICDADGACNGA